MTSHKFLKQGALCVLLAALLCVGGFAMAKTPAIKVEGAWARATVQGQKGTGAFMNITAKEGTRLVGVSSPAAGVAEVHEMKMENDIMKMRAVAGLDLPAGQTVSLKPGGYHLMLLDLKAPLMKDSSVPVTLRFRDAKGVESKLDLVLPVGFAAPGAVAGKPAEHKH